MYVKLSIPERLKDLRIERHLTLEQLAEQTGLSKSALGKYETDDFKEISPFAIAELATFYGVSADYLMGLTETKNHPNTALHELHLSDDMIEILKSERLNNRLLCEIVTHEDFRRFLVDAEIYIDRIADMRINDMNAVLATVRQQVMQDKDIDDNDLYLRTLEVAQVHEDEYFEHIFATDIGAILKDIRDKHKSDSTTADETSSCEKLQYALSGILNADGNDGDKIRTLLETLGYDNSMITDMDLSSMIEVWKQSGLFKNTVSKRGKASKKHE